MTIERVDAPPTTTVTAHGGHHGKGHQPRHQYIDQVEHPAARATERTLPAGKVIAGLVIALITAALLNSHAILRAGEGMHDGVTRDVTLAAGRPLDSFASALGLDRPRRGLDHLFGHQAKTAKGTALTDGGGGIVLAPRGASPAPEAGRSDVRPSPQPSPVGEPSGTAQPSTSREPTSEPTQQLPPATALPGHRQPSAAEPLRVFVTGDSLCTYVGAQMSNLGTAKHLVQVTTVQRNGTGLTRPDFFNWQVNAQQEMAARDPEALVMIIGGNDGWNMTTPDGKTVGWSSQAWQDEYARRVAVVMATFSEGGKRPVYWSAPPTARDPKWNGVFSRINQAVARAAASVPGARYVDLFSGTSVNGAYNDYVPYEGQNVLARQPDGIHFSYQGSRLPAGLLLDAIGADFGAVR